jgi:hypothetical protein
MSGSAAMSSPEATCLFWSLMAAVNELDYGQFAGLLATRGRPVVLEMLWEAMRFAVENDDRDGPATYASMAEAARLAMLGEGEP